jgi:hypothetical protein
VKISARALLFPAVAIFVSACGSSAVTSVAGPSATRCQVSVTNSSPTFSVTGGTGEVKVAAARECGWTASAQAPWLEITSGREGQGDGTIAYRVTANADPVPRKAGIVVGEAQTEIAQEPAACRYTVSAPSQPLDALGGKTVVEMRTHSACEWRASTDADWVTITPAAGRGDAEIAVDAGSNTGVERSLTLVVGPDRVVLRQNAAPAVPAPPPPPAPAPAPAPPVPAPPAPVPPAPAPPAPAPPAPAPPAPTPPAPAPPAPAPPAPAPPAPAPPAPAPPPPAPPPAPPAPEKVELDGKIGDVSGNCPALTFKLKGYSVRTTSATTFSGGSCKDLKDRRQVTVNGEIEGTNRVLATRIEVDR